MKTAPIRAWHFVGDTLRDGTPIPKDGVTLKFNGRPILCRRGLHASRDPFDALQYAPGDTLCLVECGGTVHEANDKLVCTERTIIVRMDAEPLMRYYARMQALSVVHLWNPPQVVLDYLMTGDEKLRDAAWAAAWAAARDAARDAAWAAARDDARAAARDAAWAAAWAAAWDDARDAAWAAARAAALGAARDADRVEFHVLVHNAFADWL